MVTPTIPLNYWSHTIA